MDIYDLNVLSLDQPHQLQQRDGEAQEKQEQADSRMAIAKRPLQTQSVSIESQFRCLSL